MWPLFINIAWWIIINALLIIYFQAFFAAFGPMFKTKHEVRPFENIELYNIMACMLNFLKY